MPRHLAPVALAVLAVLSLAAGLPPSARAGRAGAALQVSATVPAVLDYALLSAASGLTLTDADLAAGVKDVTDAAVLQVRTNGPGGFVLELALPDAPWLAGVEARVADAVGTGTPGTTLFVPVAAPADVSTLTRVNLRLRLAPGARTGAYALPVAVGLAPL